MSKRLSTIVSIFAIATVLYLGMGYLSKVGATVPCPKSGCPKGACGYQGCGDGCHCRGGCGDWSRVCTYCDPDDCSNGWENGRCGGASNCEEHRFECNCGNKAYYCHRTKKGPTGTPTPSLPPSPTPTPPPPSPTPIQPTTIITLAATPAASSFSDKAVDPANQSGQNWVCLKTVPCATGGITCSGGEAKHRVQISAKEGSQLIPNKKTYVFECMQTDKGYRCTTGNTDLDKQLLGVQHLPALTSAYGYKFVALTTTAGKAIYQSADAPSTDSKGNFGPMEWESYTTTQVGRLMMGMQVIDTGDNEAGKHGTQKLGTFNFGDQESQTTCVIIKWDPHGVIFDLDGYKPLAGVKVTLLHQEENGKFAPMKANDVFGGIVNPQLTDTDGAYAFYVPNGSYKLEVSKSGYVPYFATTLGMNGKYSDIYDGNVIVTNGKLETRNIAMRRENIFDKIFADFAGLFK